MPKRRPIADALALPADTLEFIRGRDPLATAGAMPESRLTRAPSTASCSSPEPTSAPSEIEFSQPRRRRTLNRGSGSRAVPNEGSAGPFKVLVSITTRLKPETATALRQFCLRQKLLGRAPTQQEIIEDALRNWLEGPTDFPD